MSRSLNAIGNNYKLTPATLAHKLNPQWIAAPHLSYISVRIATAIARGNGRLLISVPPRHGKSELITKYTTVWCLEQFPQWNTILATYGAELSTDFGRQVRDIIQDNEDLLSARIRADAKRTGNWRTEQGGGMMAVGVGGAITGRGGNVLLLDDYIKEIKEALSKAHKDFLWDWFKSTFYTRLEPGGTIIIIATRWAPDDIHGRILADPVIGKGWDYIEIPAIAYEDDLLGRAPGAALFPERYNIDALNEIKDTLGTYFFNALYQQRPIDDENALTSAGWLQVVDMLPPITNAPQARVWDLAATEGGGDYTVGTHAIGDKNNSTMYITNVVRRRLSPKGVENLVRQTALADGVETTIYIEQEPGASGKQLVEHYKDNVLPEFNVVACSHNDGKLARAQPFLAAAEAGRVKLLRGAWNEDFISEFASFPGGDHDDQVDTGAEAYKRLVGKKTYGVTWGRRSPSGDPQTTATGEPLIIGQKAGIIFGRGSRNNG